MKKILILSICAALLCSCNNDSEKKTTAKTDTQDVANNNENNDDGKSTASSKKVAEKENDLYKGYVKTALPLIAGKAEFMIPENLSSHATIFEDNGGVVNVTSGEKFDYRIAEQEGNVVAKKYELTSDPVYKCEILDESETSILYVRTLPDGSNEMVHFYRTMSLNDSTPITIYSASNGIFKKSHIERMIKSSNSIQLVE